MTDQPARGGFWSSLPGVLTGIAAVMTASAGLFLAFGPRASQPEPLPPRVDSANAPTSAPVDSQPDTSSPAAPAPGYSSVMGPLEPGISYSQGDMYDQPADAPEQCVQLCANDNRCLAVTYIYSQKRCWLKNRINPAQQSSDMVSARKLPL